MAVGEGKETGPKKSKTVFFFHLSLVIDLLIDAVADKDLCRLVQVLIPGKVLDTVTLADGIMGLKHVILETATTAGGRQVQQQGWQMRF